MFVFKAAVVGAGVMGGEIAQVIAAADIPVLLKDVDQKYVDAGLAKAREVTEKQVGKLVSKEKLTAEQGAEQVERTLALITGTTSYDGFGDVDFAIEAVPERMEVKHGVFAELDAATPGHAILASNTSGLSITEIGDATNRPDKVVGFHFFWPASVMRLIEIVEGEETSQATLQGAANFAQAIRKTPVRCAECPGFVVNRILTSTASEIWRYQDETGASAGGARRAHQGAGRDADGPVPGRRHERARHGPEGRARHARRLRRPLLRPQGHGGARRAAATSAPRAGRASMSTEIDPKLADRFTLKAFVEACLVLEEGVAGIRDVDLGMMMGTGMVPGPFARADLRGLDDVLAALEQAEEDWGEHFEPPLILRRLVAQGRLGRQERPGLLPLPAARGRLRAGAGQARPPRRRRRRCGSTTRPPTRSRRP